jgi:hypothetical protein
VSERLGLGIGKTTVRAVLVRDTKPVWKAARSFGEMAELTDVVHDLLASAPRGRFRRVPVVVALGPARSQVKRLDRLPTVSTRSVASQIVRGNVGRFFLRNGVPLVAPDTHRSNGAWWGAVMEAPAILAVEQACTRLNAHLEGCLPTAAAFAQVVGDGSIAWHDGDSGCSVLVSRHAWVNIRRDAPGDAAGATPVAFRTLGADGMEFADAYAAACCSRGGALILPPAARHAARRRILRGALLSLSVMSLLAALFATGLAATRQIRHDEPRLSELRDSTRKWSSTLQELAAATAALNEIERFAGSRRSMTQFLGDLADALPDSTAMVTLRVDSAGGSMTVLSRAAATVIPRLATIADIAESRISGAVTREVVEGVQLQRVAVRFASPRAKTSKSSGGP